MKLFNSINIMIKAVKERNMAAHKNKNKRMAKEMIKTAYKYD